jgi:hypothetical protein
VLAIGRPREGVDATTAIAARAREEMRDLWQLYLDGSVREAYSPGGPGAVFVLEAASVEAARDVLSELPLVADGIIEFELIELRPFTAFELLFSEESKG